MFKTTFTSLTRLKDLTINFGANELTNIYALMMGLNYLPNHDSLEKLYLEFILNKIEKIPSEMNILC